MKLLIFSCTASALLATAHSQSSEPDWSESRVTLPLSVWQEVQKPAVKPPILPVPSAFISATYSIDLSAKSPTAEGVFMVENFSGDWQFIPVAGADIPIAPDDGASFVRKDGASGFLLHGPSSLTARMKIPLQRRNSGGDTEILRLPVLPAATNRLVLLDVPPDTQVQVKDAGMIDEAHTYLLSPEARIIEIALTKFIPDSPTRWTANIGVLFQPSDQALKCVARILLKPQQGSGTSCALILPKNADSVFVESGELKNWNTAQDADGQKILNANWSTPTRSARELIVKYDLPAPVFAGEWELTAPQLSGTEDPVLVVFVPPESADVSAPGLSGGHSVAHLPDWMRKTVTGDFLLARSNKPLTVVLQWLEKAATAELIVNEARHDTRIVQDGATLTQSTHLLQAEVPTRWQFTLPKGATLLQCSLNGKSVAPVKREGSLELAIPGSSTAAKVEFSYTGKLTELDPVSGGLSIELPMTDAFIREQHWSLLLPDGYDLAGVESNASVGNAPSGATRASVWLTKRLIRGDRTQAELFYQKSGLKN